MGARNSVPTSVSPIEGSSESNNDKSQTALANDTVGTSNSITVNLSTSTQAVPMKPMPQLIRGETFEEKLYRKFTTEPLVPIGCLTTAYFLSSGIKSFMNRDPIKSQKMMRLRVGSQFVTIMIFIGYAGWDKFNFRLAPGMALPGMSALVKKSNEEQKE